MTTSPTPGAASPFLGGPTTRRMLEEILATEEEDAEDHSSLLDTWPENSRS